MAPRAAHRTFGEAACEVRRHGREPPEVGRRHRPPAKRSAGANLAEAQAEAMMPDAPRQSRSASRTPNNPPAGWGALGDCTKLLEDWPKLLRDTTRRDGQQQEPTRDA